MNAFFVDPIGDIVVLGAPDNQALSEEAEAYEALVEAATPLTIGEPPSAPIRAEVEDHAKFRAEVGGLDKLASYGTPV